jgi:hypothetical protein
VNKNRIKFIYALYNGYKRAYLYWYSRLWA